jgi:hypothetical protein
MIAAATDAQEMASENHFKVEITNDDSVINYGNLPLPGVRSIAGSAV